MTASREKIADKIVLDLLGLLGIKPTELKAKEGEEIVVNITVAEEESGLLIGYHGETLGALQYIAGQMINKGHDEWKRVVININGYRDQRELQLKQMAQNAADRAIATGNEIEMPYLTPAERRVIHLELTGRSDVTSFSEGEARSRRLIVAPKKSTQA